ncbi:MAG: OsmC family protein [Thermoleophilia bacterium]|nr:OsmC family protein [Thermoleophilia bacterium]
MPAADEHDYAVWTATWRGGMACDVAGRGFTLRVDEPEEFGGTDSGPMPTEMVVVALASCFCIALAWACRKRRIEVEGIEIDVRPRRAPGEPRHGAYAVRVRTPVDPEVIAPAVDLARRYCWVTNTLTTPPVIEYEVVGPA